MKKWIEKNKEISLGVGIDSLGFILNFIVRFVSIPIFLLTFGEENYGTYIYIFSILGLFGLLDVGLGIHVTREVAEKGRSEKLANTFFTLQIIYSIFFAILFLAVYYFLKAELNALVNPNLSIVEIELFILISILNFLQKIILSPPRFLLRGHNYLSIVNIAEQNEEIFPIFISIILVQIYPHIYVIPAAQLLVSLVTNILLWLYSRKEINYILNVSLDTHQAKQAFVFSYKFHLTKLAFIGRSYLIPVLIGSNLGSVYLATYNVYSKLLTLPINFLSKVAINFFPTIAHRGTQLFRTVRTKNLFFTSVIASILGYTLGVYLLSTPFIKLWLGADFQVFSTQDLLVLTLFYSLIFLSSLHGVIISGQNRFGKLPEVMLLEFLAFVFLGFVIEFDSFLKMFATIVILSTPSIVLLVRTIYSNIRFVIIICFSVLVYLLVILWL